MTRHVDAESMGRFSAGDLSERKSARVSAHLRQCSRCAGLRDQLAGVTTLLASTLVPPMPEHLATRIQTALAAESARRTALQPGAEPGRGELPARRARPPRRRLSSPVALRVLAVTGAVAVVAGGGYAILHGGRTSSTASSGQQATAGGQAPLARNGTQAGPVTFGPALHYASDGHTTSFMPVSTRGNYLPGTLTSQVKTTLSQVRFAAAGGGLTMQSNQPSAQPSGSFSGPGSTPAGKRSAVPTSSGVPAVTEFGGVAVGTIEACVARIAAGDPVLLVDLALYRGSRATLIVLAEPGSAARHLWVVGPGCSEHASDVLLQRVLTGG